MRKENSLSGDFQSIFKLRHLLIGGIKERAMCQTHKRDDFCRFRNQAMRQVFVEADQIVDVDV